MSEGSQNIAGSRAEEQDQDWSERMKEILKSEGVAGKEKGAVWKKVAWEEA